MFHLKRMDSLVKIGRMPFDMNGIPDPEFSFGYLYDTNTDFGKIVSNLAYFFLHNSLLFAYCLS